MWIHWFFTEYNPMTKKKKQTKKTHVHAIYYWPVGSEVLDQTSLIWSGQIWVDLGLTVL